MTILPIAISGWLTLLVLIFGVWQRETLLRFWREPVLRYPVIIIESDDWGPGPPSDGEALLRVAEVLRRHSDRTNRSAVMTLGMVLAVADGCRTDGDIAIGYRSAVLSDPRFAPILDAIRRGVAEGVFSLQLHGMEHYWPRSVLQAAAGRAEVCAWLTQQNIPRTEDLPPELQSRWVDGSVLPSRDLPTREIATAARNEVEEFKVVFGAIPAVAVPPTFVWTEAVESAWAANGVTILVTPGTRYVGRDCNGRLVESGEDHYNGQRSPCGVTYMVRDN